MSLHAFLFGVILFCSSVVFTQSDLKIHPLVGEALQKEPLTEVLVVVEAPLDIAKARYLRTKEAKAQWVYQQLRQRAERSQGPVRQRLQKGGLYFRTYWIVNAIHAVVDLPLLQQLADLPEVTAIVPNPWIKNELGQPIQITNEPIARNAPEASLALIGATELWAQGFRGQGVTIGGQDTGYEWEHPAIVRQYRGNTDKQAVDHNYNWHDAIRTLNPLNRDTTNAASNNPCGLDSNVPCDDHNHGTHTMGTMIGDDAAGNQIGVAPEAKWIGCRNMDRGWGSPASYLECFEWFLAPTDLDGANPDRSICLRRRCTKKNRSFHPGKRNARAFRLC